LPASPDAGHQRSIFNGHVLCPLLSTLDLSGLSKAGCGLRRLRLGKTHLLVGNVFKPRVQDYVDEPEPPNEDAETRGVEFPAICATVGEW